MISRSRNGAHCCIRPQNAEIGKARAWRRQRRCADGAHRRCRVIEDQRSQWTTDGTMNEARTASGLGRAAVGQGRCNRYGPCVRHESGLVIGQYPVTNRDTLNRQG